MGLGTAFANRLDSLERIFQPSTKTGYFVSACSVTFQTTTISIQNSRVVYRNKHFIRHFN